MFAAANLSQMTMSADARFAPACQAAHMTGSAYARILDTAVLAVSFLSFKRKGIVAGVVRIMFPLAAKP